MKFSIFSSLRLRLLLLVMVTLLPLFWAIVYNAIEIKKLAVKGFEADVSRMAKLTANEQEEIMERTRQILHVVSKHPAIYSNDSMTCSSFLPHC